LQRGKGVLKQSGVGRDLRVCGEFIDLILDRYGDTLLAAGESGETE